MYQEPVIEVIKPKIPEFERKIESRLEELKKLIKARKSCLQLSTVPLTSSILLFIFSCLLYYRSNLIQIIPERFSIAVSYNLTVWLAVLWLCVGIATVIYSKASKKLIAENVAMYIGLAALFTGILYIWLACWLNIGIETYTSDFAPYNVALCTGIISVVVALLILALSYRMRIKAKFL
ncbi:MAG: hypothetical protein QMC98_01375 [Candidatus Thermoplasmatota archaeon]|nr:hypothetical protein [Candidatus Thermoplasmatota archaeon]